MTPYRAGAHQGSDRVEVLLAAMTLAEKLGQLTMVTAGPPTGPGQEPDYLAAVREARAGSLLNLVGREPIRRAQRLALEETRLGVPLVFGLDVLHGHRTIFPIPLAEAGAFDPSLWERTARAAAEEAAADGVTLTFAPMLDVARDPRWGRIAEGPGEDPWLGERFAAAKVRGFQGADLRKPASLAATAKHLAGYGAVTAGRDYAAIDVSERTFREVYLPPFRAAVEAGVAAIMPAFVALAGEPMTGDAALLRDLVRGGWGFEGVIVSDYGAIPELVTQGAAANLAEAAALALKATVDVDMMGDAYATGLPVALDRGLVEVADVDTAVRRVLRLKERLGLFDDPYREAAASGLSPARRQAHRELAREAARRSAVLLTNRGGLLPLRDPPAWLAVLGPLADSCDDMLGPWSAAGSARDMVPLLDGIRAAFPTSGIAHAPGVATNSDDASGIPAALDAARDADLVILCLGEARGMSGEAASRGLPDLPGRQAELARAVLDLGKPTVVLLACGRPLPVAWLFERADAVLCTWFLGSEAGHAVGDILSGRADTGGRLPVTWPADPGQNPIFYSQLPTGRPPDPANVYSSKYLDLPTEPLFPFGHGLSYARFALEPPRVTPAELRPGGTATVEVDVRNEGEVAGEATVLLFVHGPATYPARRVMELRGMAKLALPAGGQGTVRLAVSTDDLATPGPDLAPTLVPGEYELLVGLSAEREGLLTARLRLRT